MAASDTTPIVPLFDAVDWPALARLMHIPEDRREHFIWWLQNSIKGELCYATKKPAGWRQTEKDIAEGRRDIIRGIKKLGAHAKPAQRAAIKTVEECLDKPVRRRRGAPNLDQRADDKFASFLEDLLHFARGLGGHPSFTKRTRTGNIVDLMNALRPVMPPGFIAKGLQRQSLIERFVTKTNARADPSVPAVDTIELLRGDLWRAMGDQEPMCPDCGQPVHWRKRFPIWWPRLCRDCGEPLPPVQRRRASRRTNTA